MTSPALSLLHRALPRDDDDVRAPELVRHREVAPEAWKRDQIVDRLEQLIGAHGVAVYLEAHHLCTQMRGVREVHPKTRTAVWRGEYAQNPELRNEFFHLTGVRGA